MLNLLLFAGSALLQILFVVIIFYASKGSGASEAQKSLRKSFYALSLSVVAWSIIQYAYSWSDNLTFQQIVLRLGITSTILVAGFFLWFAANISQHRISDARRATLITVTAISCLFGIFMQVAQVQNVNGEIQTTFNWWNYSFVTLIPILLFGYGIYILEADAKRIKHLDSLRAKQDIIVSRGLMLTALFAFFGNFVFSLVNTSQTISDAVTALAPAAFTIVSGYSVFSLKLFNFRKFFFRVIVYAAAFSLVYVVAGGLLIYGLQKTRLTDNEVLAGILVGGLLLYPFAAFLTKRIFELLGRGNYEVDRNLEKQLQVIFRNLDSTAMLQQTAAALQNAYGVEKVLIAVYNPETQVAVESVRAPEEQSLDDITHHTVFQLAKLHSDRQIIPEESVYRAQLNGYTLGFTMVRDSFVGAVLFGQRKNGQIIFDDERANLVKISSEIALALENSLQYTQIQRFNIELEKKIKDATVELQKSNEKLQKLDEAKDEFISMASHQLRTPLTSVKGYISMMLEGDAGEINEQQKNFLDQAFLSSQRMVYLIADLLNVSRLKTGKFIIEPKPTYLPDVVESEIAQLHETAKSRDLKLIFDKPDSFPTLNLDETKIRQVIMNFADNAIYYTPKGGKITIGLKATDDSIEYTVRDTGIGVPKSEQHHLFTKFYRAGNAKKARPDGTGLGLFMAKKVVVAQGGAIIFKTEEGKGSTFGFSFPRNKLEVEQ
ncbi:MAG: ATP-binding protein [Candidatus Saccharimonadales bacterium]